MTKTALQVSREEYTNTDQYATPIWVLRLGSIGFVAAGNSADTNPGM